MLMQKRRLGRTNLEASVIGFGAIPIIKRSRQEAVSIVRKAHELGINYFDTARVYGDSEDKVGEGLEDIREEVIIATKTHQRTREEAARAGLRQSLRKLRTDRIDLVQVHGIDSLDMLRKCLESDGSVQALKDARKEGKLDYIGMSGHVPYVLMEAVRSGEFDTILVPLNFVQRLASEELLNLARENDVGVVIMKPFGGPNFEALTWGYRVKDTEAFHKFFGTTKAEIAQRSLRYVLTHDVATVVPGLGSIEEVELAAAVGGGFSPLSSDEREAYRFGELPREPFCRECRGCLPCPDGLSIHLILRLKTWADFYGITDWAREQYQRLPSRYEDCSDCKECEAKCPYELPVISMLEQADRLLGMKI